MHKLFADRLPLIEEEIQRIFIRLEEDWFLSPIAPVCSLSKEMADQALLTEAMRYAAKGGKRIRPILLMLVFESLQDRPERMNPSDLYRRDKQPVLTFAAALEFIHAYSLVHDDLPSMDNDLYRRGELTVHAKFGEAIAILTGDGLLNLAYETLFSSLEEMDTDRSSAILAATYLARHAGLTGMIGGQTLDLQPDLLETAEAVRLMVEKKTCALIRIAARTGALLAGADSDTMNSLDRFAYHLGMAFQAKDDLFDRDQDIRENKITLISHLSEAEAEAFVEEQTHLAYEALSSIGEFPLLSEFAGILMNRKQ